MAGGRGKRISRSFEADRLTGAVPVSFEGNSGYAPVAAATQGPSLTGDPRSRRMAEQQAPTFELDIRPRFRPMGVEEMSFSFDLSAYEDVRDNADAI